MKTRKNLNVWLAMSMLLPATVCTATGGTIYVDAADGSDDNDGLSPETALVTIQKAIDAAKDGDTVLAADGTYIGTGNRDIDFLSKAITIRLRH